MNPELPAEEEMKKKPLPAWSTPQASCVLCPVADSNRSQSKVHSGSSSESGHPNCRGPTGGADVGAGAWNWAPRGLGPLL